MSLLNNERRPDDRVEKQEEDGNALIDIESGNCPEEEVKNGRSLRKILKSMVESAVCLRSKNNKEDRAKRMQPYCVALLVLLFVVVAIIFTVCPVNDIFSYIAHADE